jgi:hypothetical protein
MTITATQSAQFTLDTIAANMTRDVTLELQRAEQQIRFRIRAEFYDLKYNATIIGNPTASPSDDANLTANQISFRDHFLSDGYVIGLDSQTGFWSLDWATVGAELATSLYAVRTTVLPGPVSVATIAVINGYFAGLTSRATSRTVLADTNPTSGGDIPESDFGATSSSFYEYLALVEQQDATDHTVALKAAIRASGLGYVDDTRVTGTGGAPLTTAPTNTVDISNGTTTVTITVGGGGTGTELVAAINANSTLSAISIRGDVNGTDVLIINDLAGTLTVTNNVGDVLGDIFTLASPQSGALTDNTEVYKFA